MMGRPPLPTHIKLVQGTARPHRMNPSEPKPPLAVPERLRVGSDLFATLRDGDVLQFGIGKVPAAVLPRLTACRNLKIHSGMVVDGVMNLLDAGAIVDEPGAVTSGLVIGGPELMRRAGDDPRFRFAGVDHTHDGRVLGAIDNLVAINSALEIDLTGQVNAEAANGRQVSGAGGLADFMRGAGLSKGGRGIVALGATARGGAISRIVPTLGPGCPVTVPRNDVGLIITEFGVADLRGLDMAARANALIAVADPRHRDDLARAHRGLLG